MIESICLGRGVEALKQDGQIVGAGGSGGGWDSIYENEQSDKVLDQDTAELMWKYSTAITGAEWPLAKQPTSPCPTLTVIKFVTNILNKKDDLVVRPPRSVAEAFSRLTTA